MPPRLATLKAILGLLSVLFAQILPGIRSSEVQLFIGTTVLVVVNAAIVQIAARLFANRPGVVIVSVDDWGLPQKPPCALIHCS